MPLSMADEGKRYIISKVGGRDKIKSFLENLGFVTGADITVVSKNGDNVIVNIKDSRIAISSEMSRKIMV